MRYGLTGLDSFALMLEKHTLSSAIGLLQRLVWHHDHENGSLLPFQLVDDWPLLAPFAVIEDKRVVMTEMGKYWLKGQAKAKPVRAAKNTGFSVGFRSFWEVFPKKKAIHDAWKAWQQMEQFRPSDDQICAAVNRQLQGKDWIKEDGKFIPHPASWLRAGRWADAVTIDKGMRSEKYNPNEKF